MPEQIICADAISHLSKRDWLVQITGPIKELSIEPLSTVGFSGANLQRLRLLLEQGETRNLILKQNTITEDWLSQRSHDRVGREASLLAEPSLSKVWTRIDCPYLAYANEMGIVGLLMNDLSDYLLPDARESIGLLREDIIIDNIAALHAMFWNSQELKKPSWLTPPCDYLGLLSPGDHEEDNYCPPPEPLRSQIKEGWRIAFQLLPGDITKFMSQPIERIYSPFESLPVTLLHGDLKIANMAFMPQSRLTLIDWPLAGCAPCGIELGWYLAVNASRLARSKDEFIDAYRTSLESHLQFTIDEATWKKMEGLAIVTGAMMMLWRKALKKQSATQEGSEDWEWWLMAIKKIITA